MDEIKSIHYVLTELMRRYNEGFAVAKDDIMELCVEYEIDRHYEAMVAILDKMMPIGTIGTVEYPFGEVDIT
jgi:hypothetical protein